MRKIYKWLGNHFGDEGAGMIGEELKNNSSLTTLDLGRDENKTK